MPKTVDGRPGELITSNRPFPRLVRYRTERQRRRRDSPRRGHEDLADPIRELEVTGCAFGDEDRSAAQDRGRGPRTEEAHIVLVLDAHADQLGIVGDGGGEAPPFVGIEGMPVVDEQAARDNVRAWPCSLRPPRS